jgi:hypothetical protein
VLVPVQTVEPDFLSIGLDSYNGFQPPFYNARDLSEKISPIWRYE